MRFKDANSKSLTTEEEADASALVSCKHLLRNMKMVRVCLLNAHMLMIQIKSNTLWKSYLNCF